MDALSLAVLASVVVGVCWYAKKVSDEKTSAELAARRQAELEQARRLIELEREERISLLSSIPISPINPTDIAIKNGEKFYWKNPWTKITGERGVIDEGELYISSHRVFFVGKKKSVEIPIKSILKATPFNDGFRIDRANKTPFLAITTEPFEAVILQRIIGGNADQHVDRKEIMLENSAESGEVEAEYYERLEDLLQRDKYGS